MRLLSVCLGVLLASAAAADPNGQFMQASPAAAGRWITANHDAVVEIAPCGADLCGRIVGMVLAPGEPLPKDWKGDSQCGLTIFRVAPDPGGRSWSGSILDPRDGSVYNARITAAPDGRLNLHGYLGLPIFGQTQTWDAYPANIPSDCRLTAAP